MSVKLILLRTIDGTLLRSNRQYEKGATIIVSESVATALLKNHSDTFCLADNSVTQTSVVESTSASPELANKDLRPSVNKILKKGSKFKSK